jgi:DNA-binding NarL/FixJ family response regulator
VARIRVLLVDDHYLVRVGLANVLAFEPDIEVCAQAESGDEALALHRVHHPDVTMMDLRMPGTGFDAPSAVAPKAIVARIQGVALALTLEPKSVTVISVEQ